MAMPAVRSVRASTAAAAAMRRAASRVSTLVVASWAFAAPVTSKAALRARRRFMAILRGVDRSVRGGRRARAEASLLGDHGRERPADGDAGLLRDRDPSLPTALILRRAPVVLTRALAERLAGIDAVTGNDRHLLQPLLRNGIGLGGGRRAEEAGHRGAEKKG